MNIVNVKIEKNGNEPLAAMLRKFQKKTQESMVLPNVRAKRYATRPLSDLKVKRGKIKRLVAGVEYNKLKRLGAIVEKKKGMKR